ncbi:MAG: class I SAM-dependent methyltransferase [Halobacteriota archaeon]
MNHADPRYLEGKRSLDSRARSRRIREKLLAALPAEPTIIEVGCGTGTILPQLLQWGVDRGRYRGIDTAERLIAFARDARAAEFRHEGIPVTEQEHGFTVGDLSVTFEQADGLEVLETTADVDLVIGHAFGDLVAVPKLVTKLESALAPGGLAYLPITFDGGTIFQPDHPADRAVEQAYHEAIDAEPGRDSRAGRHLAEAFRRRKGDLLGMAGSDWILRPHGGTYPVDEGYVLRTILDFIESALSKRTVSDRADWLATRRGQLAARELTYVAHQYDLLYQMPRS